MPNYIFQQWSKPLFIQIEKRVLLVIKFIKQAQASLYQCKLLLQVPNMHIDAHS